MFSNYFSSAPDGLPPEVAGARCQRQREVENALLSHLISGYRATPAALAALQQYIDSEKSRERAFSILYGAR